jgi:hypothetical protein
MALLACFVITGGAGTWGEGRALRGGLSLGSRKLAPWAFADGASATKAAHASRTAIAAAVSVGASRNRRRVEFLFVAGPLTFQTNLACRGTAGL